MYFIQIMLPIGSLKEIPEKIHTMACLCLHFRLECWKVFHRVLQRISLTLI